MLEQDSSLQQSTFEIEVNGRAYYDKDPMVDNLILFLGYVSAFRIAFRSKFPRSEGEMGRCRMVAWQDIAIVQVINQTG